MVRAERSRRVSEARIYHVVSRGVGRQIMFEDDDDRRRYLDLLQREASRHHCSILAWCIMDNHVHLLLQAELNELSESMRVINSSYAMYFNKRYERVGHLMQGRFKSEPVNTDEYLLTVVRYIHQNPEKAGIAKTSDYAWSSYREYVGEKRITETGCTPKGVISVTTSLDKISDTAPVLELFGSVSEFEHFHKTLDFSAGCADVGRGRQILDSESALSTARSIASPLRVEEIATLPKPQRNQVLCKLKEGGLSVRQIERLTGVSKSVVSKAKMGH